MVNLRGKMKMYKQKLIDKIHEMQNEDLDKLTNVKFPSLYYSHLNGRIEAFSNAVLVILLEEEEEK